MGQSPGMAAVREARKADFVGGGMSISGGEVVVCGKKKTESETNRMCVNENDVESRAFAGHALALLAH